jgi:hypothetical protein
MYQGLKRVNLRNRVDVFISPSFFLLEKHRECNSVSTGETAVVPYGIEVASEELEKLRSLKQNHSSAMNSKASWFSVRLSKVQTETICDCT